MSGDPGCGTASAARSHLRRARRVPTYAGPAARVRHEDLPGAVRRCRAVVIVIGPEELSRAECERHLRDEVTCRVAVCTDSGPHIVPANYAFVQDMLILQTTPESTLGSHAFGRPVAVEVDDFNAIY